MELGEHRGQVAFDVADLDFGADGRIYVVDFGNNRIQVFAPLPARQR